MLFALIYLFVAILIKTTSAQICNANCAIVSVQAEYFVSVSKSLISGSTAITFKGYLDAFSALATRNWLSPVSPGIAFPGRPTTAGTTRLVSTSTSDTSSGGTGCQTVLIEGLDASGNSVSETVSMSGTTSSAATTTTFSFIQKLTCATVGTGLRNAGIISISTTTPAANGPLPLASNPVIGLPGTGVGPFGASVSTSAWYRVPTGKSFIFTSLTADVFRSGTAVTTLDAVIYVFYQVAIGSPIIYFDRISIAADGTTAFEKNYETSIVLPAGTVIWVEGVQQVVLGQFFVTVSGIIY